MLLQELIYIPHEKTYTWTGIVCNGAATRISGAIVYDLLSQEERKKRTMYRSPNRSN